MKARRLIESIGYALEGLLYALRTQRNMRIHVVLGLTAFLLGILWGFGPWELAVLTVTVTLVLAAEIFNSALEVAIDLFTSDYNHLARVAKNLAAAAVLVTALNALVIGYLLFGPRLAGILKTILR